MEKGVVLEAITIIYYSVLSALALFLSTAAARDAVCKSYYVQLC